MAVEKKKKKKKKKEAVIFDVDGTLCDVRPIRHYVDGTSGSKNFEEFHKASQFCDPHWDVVRDLREQLDQNRSVIIVTGRDRKFFNLTLSWLLSHGIVFHELLMRPPGDRRKDFAVKKEILDDLRQRYTVVHAWDDNPNVIVLWEAEGIPVTIVPGWDD